jgi:hypothetical protein
MSYRNHEANGCEHDKFRINIHVALIVCFTSLEKVGCGAKSVHVIAILLTLGPCVHTTSPPEFKIQPLRLLLSSCT